MDSLHWSSELRKKLGGGFPRLGRLGMHAFFSLLPQHIRAELFPGVVVDFDFSDLTMKATYWQGQRFEQRTGLILEQWCRDADCFFDVGSNYGFFTWWMASTFRELRVVPFEPNPLTFSKVARIAADNGLTRVEPQHRGLGDVRTKLDLHPGLEDSGHSTFGAHPGLNAASLGQVDVLPFDDWCREQGLALPPSPSWVVKIDVEGFEMKVIRGMSKALRARAFKGLCVELNAFTLNFCGTTPEEVIQSLKSFGYCLIESRSGNGFFVPD